MRALLNALLGLIFGPGVSAESSREAARRHLEVMTTSADHSSALAERSEGRVTMNAAYEKLVQHLDNQNIGYWSRSEDKSICTDFRGEIGTYRVYASVDIDGSLFQVFGYSPVRIPEGSRPAVAETIVRANHGLKLGKFEMNYDGGEVHFQVAQILLDDNLEDEMICRLFVTTLAMLNTYLPAILSVIYGNELPKDAVSHAEPRGFGVDEGDSTGERRTDD
jgi:hypothetical protein